MQNFQATLRTSFWDVQTWLRYFLKHQLHATISIAKLWLTFYVPMSGVGLIDCQVTLKEIRTKMGNLNQQELNQFILGIIGRLERTTEGKSETCLGHAVAFFWESFPTIPNV